MYLEDPEIYAEKINDFDEAAARDEEEQYYFEDWLKKHNLCIWDLSTQEQESYWKEYHMHQRYVHATQFDLYGVSDNDFR